MNSYTEIGTGRRLGAFGPLPKIYNRWFGVRKSHDLPWRQIKVPTHQPSSGLAIAWSNVETAVVACN